MMEGDSGGVVGDGGEITVTLRVEGSGEISTVTVTPNVSLQQLRTKFPQSLYSHPQLWFVVGNAVVQRNNEDALTVVDALPKLFSQNVPHHPKFTFPGVEYRTLLYPVKDVSMPVLCALIVRLSTGDFRNADEANYLFPLPFTHSSVSPQYIFSLYESCAVGDSVRLDELLDRWPRSVDAAEYFTSKGVSFISSPLHIAAEKGHLAITQALISHFSSSVTQILNNHGQTPLFMALTKKHIKVAAELINQDPSSILPSKKDNNENSPRYLLDRYSDEELLELAKDIDLSALRNVPLLARRILVASLATNESDTFESVLNDLTNVTGFVNKRDELGWTLLHHAVTCSSAAAVDVLLANKADPEILDNWGFSPLSLASQQGKTEVIRKLMTENVSNQAVSEALYQALKHEHTEAAKVVLQTMPPDCILTQKTWRLLVDLAREDYKSYAHVLQVAPSLDAKCVLLNQFLFEAVEFGDRTTLFSLLAKVEIDINFQDYLGQTALHMAALNGDSVLFYSLMGHSDIEFNIRNWRGETALHYAAKAGNVDVVELLVGCDDVDLCVQDSAGRTPALSALHWNRSNVLDVFLKSGFNQDYLNIPDFQGMTVLHFASKMSKGTLKTVMGLSYDKLGKHDISNEVPAGAGKMPMGENKLLDEIYCCDIDNGDIQRNEPRVHLKCEIPNEVLSRLSASKKSRCDCKREVCSTKYCTLYYQNHICPPKAKKKVRTRKITFGNSRPSAVTKTDHPLHTAVKCRDAELVRILSTSKDQLLSKDSVGRTPLGLAIDLLLTDVVQALMTLCKMHQVLDIAEIVPLMNRCIKATTFENDDPSNRCQILEYLLQFYADLGNSGVRELPSEPEHPVSVAASHGRTDCVNLLLKHSDTIGTTDPILKAISHGQSEILDMLLEKLCSALGANSLTQVLGGIYDSDGVGILGKVVLSKGDNGLGIIRSLLKYCPNIIDFPIRREVKITTHSFLCSSANGVTVINNCKGNTVVELLAEQTYKSKAEKALWEEVGCCLIENGACDSILEVGNGKIVHASCAALSSAIRNGFWKMAELLILKKDTGKQLWKCALSEQLSSCMQSIGLIIDDIIYYLCQSQTSDSLLVTFLKQGLELEKSGEISSNIFAEAQEHRLFWISQFRGRGWCFDDSVLKYHEMLFKIPDGALNVKSPVERAITLSMLPVVCWNRDKVRNPKYTLLFKLQNPKKKTKVSVKTPDVQTLESPSMATPNNPPGNLVNTPLLSTNGPSASPNPRDGDGSGTDPRIVFTPNNPPRRFMSQHSRKLARSHSLRYHNAPTMPSIFYIQPSTYSPHTPLSFFSPIGPQSPVLSPSTAMGEYTYVSSVPTSPGPNQDQTTPLNPIEPFTHRKLVKIYLRTPFSKQMVQSVANILCIQPTMTSKRTFARWLKDWKVDAKTGIVPTRNIFDPEDRAAFMLARTTMNISTAASNHQMSLLHEACLQGNIEVVKKILDVADLDYLNAIYCNGSRTRNYNVSAVGMAALGGHIEVVKSLLNSGLEAVWPDVQLALQAPSTLDFALRENILVTILKSLPSLKVDDRNFGDDVYTVTKGNYVRALSIFLHVYANDRQDLLSKTSKSHMENMSDALNYALKRDFKEGAQMLVEFMSERSLLTSVEMSVSLNLSAKKGHWEVCSFLLDIIPNKEALLSGTKEVRVLHYVAAQNQLAILKKFVSKFVIHTGAAEGGEEQIKETTGNVVVMEEKGVRGNVSEENIDEVIKPQNVDLINIADSGNYTPLDLALHHQHHDIICLLLIYGAVPNKQKITLHSKSEILKLEYETIFKGSHFWHESKDENLSEREATGEGIYGAIDHVQNSYLLKNLLSCSRLAKNLMISLVNAACCLGFNDVLQAVLGERPELLDEKSSKQSGLFFAVLNGNIETIKILLEKGASFEDSSFLVAGLLYSSCSRLRYMCPRKIYHNDDRGSLLLPADYIHITKPYISDYLHTVYAKYAKYMVNVDNTTEASEEMIAILLNTVRAEWTGNENSLERQLDIMYLVAVLGNVSITAEVYSKLPLPSDSLVLRWDVKKVPVTFIDATLVLHHPDKAKENILAIKAVQKSVNIHACSVITSHLFGSELTHALTQGVYMSFCPEFMKDDDGKILVLESFSVLLKQNRIALFSNSASPLVNCKEINWSAKEKSEFLRQLLFSAVKSNSVEAVQSVLSLGADPLLCSTCMLKKDESRKRGQVWSALHLACYMGQLEVLKVLVKSVSVIDSVICDTLTKNGYAKELAYLASACGHVPLLEWLKNQDLISFDESVSLPSPSWDVLHDPCSCLRTALINGQEKAVQWLMHFQGQFTNEYENMDKETGLYHYAACLKNQNFGSDVIKHLYGAGLPGLHLQDSHGFTALDCAQLMGNLTTLECILDLDETCKSGEATPDDLIQSLPHGALRHCLDISASPVEVDGIKPILKKKNKKDKDLLTSRLELSDDRMSFWIIRSQTPTFMKTCRTSKNDLKTRMEDWLRIAGASGCRKSIRMLLESAKRLGIGKELSLFDALAAAISRRKLDCARLLIENNFINPMEVSCKGETILHIAVKTCDRHTLETVVSWLNPEALETKLLHLEDSKGLTPTYLAQSLHGMSEQLSEVTGVEMTKALEVDILLTLSESPTAANKQAVINEIRRGKVDFVRRLFRAIDEGKVASTVLCVEEVLHWVVCVLPEKSAFDIISEYNISNPTNVTQRWTGLSLAECAFLLGRLGLALKLKELIGGQFVKEEGMMWSLLSEMNGYHPQELYSLICSDDHLSNLESLVDSAVSVQTVAKNELKPENIRYPPVQYDCSSPSDVVKERITSRTIPKLKSMLVDILDLDNVDVIVDWESLAITDDMDYDKSGDGSLADAFHHHEKLGVPYAGLGCTLSDCSMYIHTIKRHLGSNALNNFPFPTLNCITIQGSLPSSAVPCGLVWKFDWRKGKVIYNPDAMPFWNVLRCAGQIALDWGHSLELICRRDVNKRAILTYDVDWSSIFALFPNGNVPLHVLNATSAELSRVAKVMNSQNLFKTHYDRIHVSLTSDPGLISESAHSQIDINLQLTTSENGWQAHEINIDQFLENHIIQDYLDKTSVTDVIKHLDSIRVYSRFDKPSGPVAVQAVFDLDETSLRRVTAMTLRDMSGPGCVRTTVKKLRKIIQEEARQCLETGICKINSGSFIINKGDPEYKYLNLSHNKGHLEVTDPSLDAKFEALSTLFAHVNPIEDLKDGALFNVKLEPVDMETDWSTANLLCHDIPEFLIEKRILLQTEHWITQCMKQLVVLLPSIADTKTSLIRDQLVENFAGMESPFKAGYWKDLRKMMDFCTEIKKLYIRLSRFAELPAYKTEVIGEQMRRLWNERLENRQPHPGQKGANSFNQRARSLKGVLQNIGCEQIGKDIVCASECTLSPESLNRIYFLFSEIRHRSPAGPVKEKELHLQLRDIDGNLTKYTEKTPTIKIVLSHSRTDKRIPVKVEKVITTANASGIEFVMSTNKVQKAFAETLGSSHDWSLGILLDNCHIQHSPFTLLSSPPFQVKQERNEQFQRLSTLLEKDVGVILKHDLQFCTRNKVTVLAKSKPSQFMKKNKLRSELANEGYQHVWSLGRIHCYSDGPILSRSEVIEPGVLHIRVKPLRSGQCFKVKAYCNGCCKFLKFATENGFVDKLEFMTSAGKPSPVRSNVVDQNGQDIPPSTKPSWTITAGDKLTFLFLPLDKKLNTYNSLMNATLEFMFVSNDGSHATKFEDKISACFLDNGSVVEVQTQALCTTGEFSLFMNGHRVGSKDASYNVVVKPGDVHLPSCAITGDGLSVLHGSEYARFTVVLKDALDNIVEYKGPVAKSGLEVSFSPDKAKSHLRYDECSYICTYTVAQDLKSDMLMSVKYKGKHLPGSPFSVKWTSSKSFNQRHQELRKTLSRMKKKGGKVELSVDRNQVVADSLRTIGTIDPARLLYPLKVEFWGEQGYDAGGLTREWYQLLLQSLFDPNYALFEQLEDGRYRPSYNSAIQDDHLILFNFFGRIAAKAIFDGVGLDIHMVHSFYKNILDIPTHFSDVASEDKVLYRSLSELSAMETEEEVECLCLTFAIDESKFGSTDCHVLKTGGDDVDVTLSNRLEYIQLYTNYVCNVRVQEQLKHFKEGFASVLPLNLLSEFNHKDFEFLMCGYSQVEIPRLMALTTYEGGYNPTSKPVVWLWHLLEHWTQDLRKSFLQFVTGNPRIPACTKEWRLYINKTPPSDKLPTASTCFNIVNLPAYKSERLLRTLVTKAITLGSEGFGNI